MRRKVRKELIGRFGQALEGRLPQFRFHKKKVHRPAWAWPLAPNLTSFAGSVGHDPASPGRCGGVANCPVKSLWGKGFSPCQGVVAVARSLTVRPPNPPPLPHPRRQSPGRRILGAIKWWSGKDFRRQRRVSARG
jgi:hypothetical protein